MANTRRSRSRSFAGGVAKRSATSAMRSGRTVLRWTSDAAAGKRSNSPLLMLPKMIALMGLVAVAVLLLPIDVIAFAIGYSIFIVSILTESIYSAMKTPDGENSHG